jgi:prepilin-type N-terminal cleavage/methylation domain-containing protein
MNAKTQKKGFTIIEVVLVLAIAGLIFLMVFIALPALQRSQRDGQRDQDLSRVQTAIQAYQTNNRSNIPTADTATLTSFTTRYMKVNGEEFKDPSGKDYQIVPQPSLAAITGTSDASNSAQAVVRVYYTTGATCGTDGALTGGQGSRKASVRLVLEGGGIACRSN